MTAKVLYVDDQRPARELFRRMLDRGRFEALTAASVAQAVEVLGQGGVEAVVTDLRMPEVDGLEGLRRFHDLDPALPVILITAFGTVETAVEAMKRSAFDYLRKPFEPSELEVVLDRAVAHRALVRENERLRSQVAAAGCARELVARSAAMRRVVDLVERVAPTDFAVLLQGESGTGKDVVARLIHRMSKRAERPLVSLNCAAIPEHSLESELFGYERGAFSGATAPKPGFFREADGGTLLLDEIAEMSLGLQPKLLRVLQDGEFYPVGSRRAERTDTRLISASNRDLDRLVAQGRFRQDLFYRVNTVRVVLPPLRERPEDIPLLVEHFLARLRDRDQPAPKRVTAAALRKLQAHLWPGNVRELEHAVERIALVCDGDVAEPHHLPPELGGGPEPPPPTSAPDTSKPFKAARADFERAYFSALLAEVDGNVQRAAERAGIHRSTFYEKLSRLGLTPHG